ncbi:uncharacterized protein LOC105195374 [Solenopsis invicta]|uniref:uncharacterized protein LOC105195374 n=1 Tax=Solenopsis invicta TaxID=13686 RepID=UPI00193D5CB4|nr:uncharacterized protein LOC105195374 [Solenopsis invicta]
MENNDEDDALKRICHTAPCGWLVYKPHTRDEVDFMRSPCVCPNGSYKCVRVGDNLSVNAYVYRCRQNTTANDIEAPNKTTT